MSENRVVFLTELAVENLQLIAHVWRTHTTGPQEPLVAEHWIAVIHRARVREAGSRILGH
jgi:hypothetical protein